MENQKCRIWSSKRPKSVYEIPQSTRALLVSCPIIRNWIVRTFLTNVILLWSSAKGCCIKIRFSNSSITVPTWTPLGWVSPRYAIPVKKHLDEKLPSRWMLDEGPVPCPARSTDLTYVTFFSGIIGKSKYSESYPSIFRPQDINSSYGCEYYKRSTPERRNIERKLPCLSCQKRGHVETWLHVDTFTNTSFNIHFKSLKLNLFYRCMHIASLQCFINTL